MNADERDEAVRRIMALRVRKLVYWRRKDGNPIPEDLVQNIIRRRVWTYWGYPRLIAVLKEEFGIDQDRAASMTATAIREGFEDGKLYGIGDDEPGVAGKTVGSPDAGEPGGDSTPPAGPG